VIPSRETLARLQSEHGFAAARLEIILRLRDLLRAIGEDAFLAGRLVLKGGTALNLCFGPPPRLSVDLDFNYIGALEAEKASEERPATISTLERIARRAGYRVQLSRDEHAGRKLYLRYSSSLGGEGRLDVDINFMHRIPLAGTQHLPFWCPSGDAELLVTVVGSAELIAGKAIALLDRVAPRDLYDMASIQKRRRTFPLGNETRSMFIALSGVLSQPLTRYSLERLERITDSSVARDLHPMLRNGEQPIAGDLRKEVAQVMRSWLTLSEDETRYVQLLQMGELKPELVFPKNREMAEKIRLHPALQWKARNAAFRAHRQPSPSARE